MKKETSLSPYLSKDNRNKMLCCAACGSSVCSGERLNRCGVLYRVWGDQGVFPTHFRRSVYELTDQRMEAVSNGKRGFEDFRILCCACHLSGDFHLNQQQFLGSACQRCRIAVDCGFRNVRHYERVMRMIMR